MAHRCVCTSKPAAFQLQQQNLIVTADDIDYGDWFLQLMIIENTCQCFRPFLLFEKVLMNGCFWTSISMLHWEYTGSPYQCCLLLASRVLCHICCLSTGVISFHLPPTIFYCTLSSMVSRNLLIHQNLNSLWIVL